MSTPNDCSTRFLITSPIQENESFRWYVARVADRNDALAFVQPWLESVTHATRWIPMFSRLTGTSSDVLRSHGSIETKQGSTTTVVRYGNAILPVNQVWRSKRNVCLQCLAIDGISRGYWDLKMYCFCHMHGTRLVSKCSKCRQDLSWGARWQDVCSCGLPLSDVKTNTAGLWTRRDVSGLIALSFNQSINGDYSTQPVVHGHHSLSLNWILILIEFVRYVLLPGFWKEFRMDAMNLKDNELDRLIFAMLSDDDYRESLCNEIFSRAMKKPARSQQTLMPGNGAMSVKYYLGGSIRDIRFHRSLWSLHWLTPRYKAKPSRSVRRRNRPVLDKRQRHISSSRAESTLPK